jgi:tetratricopeptide (TPR) repeat protein
MKISTFQQVLAPVVACATALLLVVSPLAYADESQEIIKLYRQGNLPQALQRVDAFLASKPKDAQMLFQKGLILTEQNKIPEAIRIFSSLAADHPNLPEPYNNLAVLYASQGQYEKAKDALERAIRTHPSYSTAHENLGDIYAKMASQAYDKALQLDKSNAAAQTKLSLIKDLFTDGSKGVKIAVAKSAGTPPAKAAEKVAEVAVEKPAPERLAAVEESSVKSPANSGSHEEIIKTVNDWAKSWSTKDVATYLSFYSKDFQTAGGVARSAWEKGRHERIEKPKSILVSITSPKVTIIDASHAKITFKQVYQSDSLKNNTIKTLVLIKAGDKWVIQKEHVGQ